MSRQDLGELQAGEARVQEPRRGVRRRGSRTYVTKIMSRSRCEDLPAKDVLREIELS